MKKLLILILLFAGLAFGNRFYENKYNSIDTAYILFEFDDNYQSAVDTGISYLNSLGYMATINMDNHKLMPPFTTWPQANDSTLLALQGIGNHVFAHSNKFLVDPDAQTSSTLRNQYYNMASVMLRRGYKVPFIVSWPYGHDTYGKTVIQDIYDYGRRCSNAGYSHGLNVVPIEDSVRLSQYDVMPLYATDTAVIKASIDSAIARKEILAIRWHAIGLASTEAINSKTAHFKSIVDYCKLKDDAGLLEVRTFRDFLKIKPSISGISRRNSKTNYVTVYGFGFEDSTQEATVTIDGDTCSKFNQQYNSITIAVPSGIGDGDKNLITTNSDGYSDTINIEMLDGYQDSARLIDNASVFCGAFFDEKRQLSNLTNFPVWLDLSYMPKLFPIADTSSKIGVADISGNPISQITSKWVESIDTANDKASVFFSMDICVGNRKELSVQSGASLNSPNSNTVFSNAGCFMRLGLEEKTGNPIDAMGNYSPAIVAGTGAPTQTAAGAFGNSNAYEFNNKSCYINCGDVTQLNAADSFTIEFLFYTDTNSVQQIVSKYKSDADFFNVSIAKLWGIYIGAGRTATGGYYVASSDTFFGFTDSVWANKWHHGVVVFQGKGTTNNDRLRLYVDGQRDSLRMIAGTVDSVTASLAGYDLKIGNGNVGLGVNGKLDEINFYNGLKTDDWIAARYDNLLGGGLMVDYEDVFPSKYYWNPTTGNNQFDVATNWQQGAVPSRSDTIVFDGSVSVANCTLDTDVYLTTIIFQNSYSGDFYIFGNDTIGNDINFNGDGTIYLNNSNILFKSNVALSQTINAGTSQVTFSGTGNQTITSNGRALSGVVIAKTAGSFANSDVMACDALDINDGETTIANNVTVSGDVTNDANDAFTVSDSITVTGAAAQFHVASSVTPTMTSASILTTGAAPVIDIDANATVGRLQLGASSRASVTGGGTVTYTAPPTQGDIVLTNGTVTFGAGLDIDSLVLTYGTVSFSGTDSIKMATSINANFNCSGDTIIQKYVSGTGGNVIKDVTSMWKILPNGRITGLDGDTLPTTQFLGSGGF